MQEKFENKLPVNIWNKIKSDVYKEIESKDIFEIPRIQDKHFLWLYKLNKSDFESKATSQVNEQTSGVRNSIIRFNETENTLIGMIKNSYLEHLEDYSQTLLKYKKNAEKEKENFDVLKKLCDEVIKYKNDIETLIFN